MKYLHTYGALVFSLIALAISGCTSLGLQPIPNVYEEVESPAEGAYVTLGSYEAIQDSVIVTCGSAEADTVVGDTCVQLITIEQLIRPGVTAAGLVGAEYADIDARIKELGPEAPAEWVALAAEAAGRLSAAYGPIKDDVEIFLDMASNLTLVE
jgi:hypothetical protein